MKPSQLDITCPIQNNLKMVKLISILFLILTFSINIEAEEDDKPSGGLLEEVLGKAPSGDNSMYIFKTKRHVQVSVPRILLLSPE